MAMLCLVTYPEKILQQKAEQVLTITPEIKTLIRQMIETMYAADGIGLAAPQIGVSKRIIVLETSNNPRENKGLPRSKAGKPLAFLNPKTIKKSKAQETEEEGCLSLPGIFLPIKRAKEVEVVCRTTEGKPIRLKAEGLAARILQHEIDHLQGKLIIDRIPLWKRFSIKRSLKSKGKISSRQN